MSAREAGNAAVYRLSVHVALEIGEMLLCRCLRESEGRRGCM